MDRWEWTKVGTAVSAAVVVALSAGWFSGQVIKPDYPDRPAFRVEGIPPVNLAALQRSWPAGLAEPGDGSAKECTRGAKKYTCLLTPQHTKKHPPRRNTAAGRV